ncbi:MAG: NADH-quinone oxidoreductase subunit C [Candidatus Gastranaerophilales bacterium]|nr:NADH-quinone oxidoreductase subunit C [Candidatus Gastranaerophilales bacterium]
MNWTISQNNKVINLADISVVNMSELREDIIKQAKHNKRVIGYFGQYEDEKIKLYVILADDKNSELLLSSSIFDKNDSYDSITEEMPVFHMFEREFYEEFGIEPIGHPWLKPVRTHKKEYPFFKMDGEEVHEIAVGPIHAGIIEPGHFRFMCNGEKIYDLEIQLGYQHRNVEQLFLQSKGFSSHLAESIAGDTVIGHNLAYSNAMESLLNIEISNKAALIRLIALEMERIAIHIGDLGAISNDIAYLMGNAVFGATRTLVINTLLEISGSRFGRGLIRTGGVVYDIDRKLTDRINAMLDKILKDVERMTETMFSSASVLSRLERTGTLNTEKAHELGMVGLAARASGISLDVRVDYPCKWDKDLCLNKIIMQNGDVYSRAYIRYQEINQSAKIIKDLLLKLFLYDKEPLLVKTDKTLFPNSLVVSMVEGWRGEIVHVAITNKIGGLTRYKIKDPSFNNWYGLAVAVRNNGISDFPLCNKSFNLSYCGNDL